MSRTFMDYPLTNLPKVLTPTIVQFEKNTPHFQDLYRRLFEENQELALWLRQQTEQSYTDIDDREAAASLALQVLSILSNQVAINGLTDLYQAGFESTIPKT